MLLRSLALGLALLPSLTGCGRTPFDLQFVVDELEREPEQDPVAEGCRKVDYLFVVDNSASMGDNQRRLIDSFDVFIEGVQRTQQDLESVHLGVVTTDQYLAQGPGCDHVGGLVTRTAGHNSSEADCGPYAEGHNYMTEADDFSQTFPCAAKVGTTGSSTEAPLQAVTAAVSGPLTEPGACNDGFIRDDALLVVVIVTDEDDPGPVHHRYETLVEAKDGRSDNIVVVALINEPGTDCRLSGHASEGEELFAFASQFLHSFVAPVCGDHAAAFTQAVSVVQAACWDAGT